MITLKDFMEVCEYRITEGSEHTWNCYGPDSYYLDSWDGDQSGYGLTLIFDRSSQVVYEAQAHDYQNNRAYRLINPLFKDAHRDEAQDRDVDANQAWDDVNYVDLETEEDFLKKARAIVAGEEYDDRVDVPLRLDDDKLFELMKLAHEKDITLNQLVENILRAEIKRVTAEQELIESLEKSLDVKPKKKKNRK